MFIESDGVIYKFTSPVYKKELEILKPDRFEDFEMISLSSDVFYIKYTWLDSIRLYDKIISKKQTSISFIIDHKRNILLIFSDSESKINHLLATIKYYLDSELEKIDVFNLFLKDKKQINDFKISSLDINDTNGLKTINLIDLKNRKYKDFINKNYNNITSFTIQINNSYIHIDKSSLIGVPNNSDKQKVLEFLKGVDSHLVQSSS
ncbi:hypothetical protein MUO14_03605 [Halobacillus shinanisalinarum]|uniref:Uncharacterized protein n=1 Tax=Halobacillus shinanisalinarum TaxID=2932258 RepID=A0ABY4H1K5_9BACI|nr:hypothetical protein [Halobacillus shinanisalinarum]UOQ94068.1 hypothetical protein MUO14_03605 [Halobacillus shinanisalinarum]